jgi:hypothetical protein
MDVWRSVETVNARSLICAQIECSEIAAVQPRGPIGLLKGTVLRKLTIERFRDIIEEMYKENDHDPRK